MKSKYLTTTEASEYLRITVAHLYDLVATGKIKAFRPSKGKKGKLLFTVEMLDQYVQS